MLGSLGDWVSSLTTVLGDLADPHWWIRVGEGILGITLTAAGFYLLVRHELPDPSDLAKVAAVAE